MKTIEQIALEVAHEMPIESMFDIPGYSVAFAQKFLAAWLEQQEPAAIYAGVEGDNGYEVITTFVDIPDLAPLFLAPPPSKSKLDSEYTRGRNDGYEAAMLFVKQQSQEPVAEVHPTHLGPDENGGHWCREILLYSGNNPNDFVGDKNIRVKLYTAPPPAIPEGYVLVPKEPSVAMISAGDKAMLGSGNWRTLYKAMLKAVQGEQE